jgi:hypothetical protein
MKKTANDGERSGDTPRTLSPDLGSTPPEGVASSPSGTASSRSTMRLALSTLARRPDQSAARVTEHRPV